MTLGGFTEESKRRGLKPGGDYEQSQKDAATKVAWITGGFALAGTLITVFFTGNNVGAKDPPPPPPTTSISPVVPPSAPPITETTSLPPAVGTPTPTPLVPREVVGNWCGGPTGQANIRLRIAESADYVFWDVNVPNSPPNSGKVAVKGATMEFYSDDGSINSFPWSAEETPRGELLHVGVYHYLRE